MAVQSGAGARNKGKEAERQVIAILQPVVTEVYETHGLPVPVLQRNLMQADRGGADLTGLAWLALEVKRQEALNVPQWWRQTCEQAKRHQEPVLFYRRNNEAWTVRLLGYLHTASGQAWGWTQVPVHVSVEVFVLWFRKRLSFELTRGE